MSQMLYKYGLIFGLDSLRIMDHDCLNIKKELSALTQDNLTISACYTKFKKLYDDLLSIYSVPKCTCNCTCKAKSGIEEHEKNMKVTQFLMGLSDAFKNIRGQLLMMSHMSKLTEVLSLLQ